MGLERATAAKSSKKYRGLHWRIPAQMQGVVALVGWTPGLPVNIMCLIESRVFFPSCVEHKWPRCRAYTVEEQREQAHSKRMLLRHLAAADVEGELLA